MPLVRLSLIGRWNTVTASPFSMLQRTITAEASAMIGPAELEDIRLDLEAREHAHKAQACAAAQAKEGTAAARFPLAQDDPQKAKVMNAYPRPRD